MNKKRAQENVDRQARLKALQSQQRASERKRNSLIFGGIALVIVAIIVAVTIVIVQQVRENDRLDALAEQPIEGLETIEVTSFEHVPGPVEYEQSPPVGGDHNAIWTNCGIYTEPIPNENTVHSLEHGAVWITYQPDLEQSEIDALTDLVGERSYVLLSPYEGQESPIMASAWGLQLGVDSADDERLVAFLTKYIQGEQTREPGAACSGALDPSA
ncbi:hypothetical protein ASH00_04495 [Arthrobacter sp. Soil782]|uniref:DUF3105 domain-containing protein n=1 Tax=Arthrobacter sp. Soil782 TaxID=1736410 RepID=UPI0006F1D708|nr:DUF3105 domain-containing protein [Arthrobacter sp. Soil782]KRF08941.1 hypothetical protein ASH00_04495 [Arthrobacter sp. Soil782]